MLLDTTTQVQSPQSDTAAQPQGQSTGDGPDARINEWEKQSDKLEKLNNKLEKITIGAYVAYSIALDGIIVCLFPM